MGYPPFAEFCNFISREARIACNPVISNKIFKDEESKKEEIAKPVRVGRIYNPRSLFTDSAEVKRENSGSKRDDSKQERSVQCASCKGPHNLDDCKAFLRLSAKERVSFVRAKGLCLGCLRWGHMRKDCRRRAVCKSCHGFHPTSLHDGTFVPKKELKENSDQEIEVKEVSSKCTKISDQRQDDCAAHSLIVPVWIHHRDNPSQEVLVYALLDDQSDGCFIKNDVVERMAVKGVQVKLKLSTVLAERLIDCQKVNGLVVRGLNESEIIPLPGTYSREIIPARRGQIPRPETARKWPHLERIADQLMPHRSDVEIGLLIGLNCARAIKPREVIPGKDDEPYAKKTALGWGVIGIVDPDCKDVHEKCGCHRILAREVVGETKKPLHFSMRTQTKEIMTPFQVWKMFELDFDESQDEERTLSYNDRKFMQRMKNGINQREDGHYEIPLPFKDDRINLPNNRELAVTRLMRLKGRLERDETYRKHYQEFMKEMLSKGYAEKVPQSKESGDDGQVWYIPHHGVYHPQKKDKIRVVFDGSAEYKGESLNRHLLKGPDLTNNLSGVLCRFRKEPVALMCDIEGMFHQVKVNVEHRNFLRFLWWEDGDTNNPLTEYRMTVHLFGAVSSPGCSNFALKSTADDYEIEFDKEAAEFIRNDFYVDDGLKSVPAIAQAIALIENTKALCQRGGFNLHKFLSNSKAVIESIPIEARAKCLKNLDITKDLLPIERALGVQWCIESDQLQFKIELKDRPLTRRGILATVSSIYDPLGMVAPFVLVGKRILQDLTRDNVGWDDKVPESIRPRWEKWRSELHRLAELKIPRCYKPEGFVECKTVEIHNFSDASTNGYGQCSYLRMVNDRDEIHCALVMAKARVTPLRPITVPRIELTAALVSAKVSGFLKKELKYEEIAEVFWTDSKVVLGYISNDAKRFHTFVANRVQQIRERASPHQWKYVETSMNPADDASRGLSAQELIESKRWWNGPSFLWHPIKESQTLSETFTVINHSDPEVKKVTALATHSKEYPTILERVKYFSDWYRAKRAIVICKKFVQKLAWTINARKERVDPYKSRRDGTSTRERVQFDVRDLQQAETLILKAVQSQSFPEEMRALKALGRPAEKIVKSSSLLRLSPFLDENQVLRVGGRIGLADLPFQVKHPVILPKKCHVPGLVIRHYHQRAHQGKARTLADIRAAGLWIIDGSSAVGHYISKCVACQRLRGATQKQKMSDLPKDRLEEAPPFTYSAVDYFGPWYIKEGRRELKRYGVLFTCMASRAVHIETAASLTTDSFINAYRRFTGRRGPVRQLRSDQGTNFVGARNELDAAMKEMDQDAIKRELIKTNCDWIQFKMNVPHASHMGGVWERQIRSVRSVLTALLQTHGKQLDDESLRTLMIEAEAIVNSRPLTTNGLTEPDSLEALTPSHLLTMKTTIVMPPPGDFQRADLYSRKRWRRVQHLTNEFWQRWRRCYLQSLQERQKWLRPRKNLSVDDIVILKDADNPRSKWQLARIVEPYKDEDGYVRKVKIAVSSPHLDSSGRRTGSKMTYLERPIHKLVLLLRSDDN